MMSRVLVTGGSGFIGKWTVKRLIEMGRKVMILDHVRSRHDVDLPDSVDVFYGDVRDATAVCEAMAHVDSWIHLAGVLGTQETIQNPVPAAETNVLGGLNVLQAAAQYGLPGVNIAVGNWWMNNTYSLTKNCVERFCLMYRDERGLPVSVVRALNAYGPLQSAAAPYGASKVRKIMPSFVNRVLHGEPIEVYGDGKQVMDMIWVGDVANVLCAALESTERSGGADRVFEAGTGRRTTVLEVAEEVIRTVGHGEVRFLPMRPGEPPQSVVLADVATLEPLKPLGVDAGGFVSLEDGVAQTVDYFRSLL